MLPFCLHLLLAYAHDERKNLVTLRSATAMGAFSLRSNCSVYG
ncbi:hypothetical protein BofuT4_uP013860.1 [Botrytis cinerea T4]|uniref:Uncharacterized protein n=1 Tax=Botryotinia fuckeliana (strain T4) TaxID=999810 RepID=G2XN02_BOTF4|nr:hypothetical protein BofuT4_uP013860.1 [Botrytis cinerea T4]